MFYKETMEQIQTETMEQMQTETMEQMQTETMEQMQTETMEQMQTETKEQIKKRKQYLSLFVNLFNKSNLPDVLNMILNELLQKLPRDDNVFTLENKIVYKN
jgi:signal recognition particle GTPase